MFERFTDRARRVVVLAKAEIGDSKRLIDPDDVLAAILVEGESLAAKALAAVSLDIEASTVRLMADRMVKRSPRTASQEFAPNTIKALELALREALQLGHNYIGPEHILLGLVREGSIAAVVGPDLDPIRKAVINAIVGPTATPPPKPVKTPSPLDEVLAAARDVVDWFWHNGCGNDEAAARLKRLMFALEAETPI